MLKDEGVSLIEFLHKYWEAKPPNTYINGNVPIDAGYILPDLEALRLRMLPFIHSPGPQVVDSRDNHEIYIGKVYVQDREAGHKKASVSSSGYE